MLDERQIKVCQLLSVGTPAIEIAQIVGISRTSVYDWKKNIEVKAMLEELERDFISTTKQSVVSYGAKAVAILKNLAEHSDSEKIRLDAVGKLLDKVISNAVKIDIADARDSKDTVTADVLAEELNDIDAE